MNYNSDENEFVKNELNKYRNEVENIINNFRQKKQSKSFSMIGKNKKNVNKNLNNIYILDKFKDDTSYDNSNNDLVRGFSINKSISNQIHNNDNSMNNNNNDNLKKKISKKKSNKVVSFIDDEKNNMKNNKNNKSRNKERISPKDKREFKDKRLKNLMDHLSLIEEESEPSLSIVRRLKKQKDVLS